MYSHPVGACRRSARVALRMQSWRWDIQRIHAMVVGEEKRRTSGYGGGDVGKVAARRIRLLPAGCPIANGDRGCPRWSISTGQRPADHDWSCKSSFYLRLWQRHFPVVLAMTYADKRTVIQISGMYLPGPREPWDLRPLVPHASKFMNQGQSMNSRPVSA